MSDLRIGLIAEGPTDYVIIEAVLRSILPSPFTLILLQPEATRPDLGGGWGGVLKWCGEFRSRGVQSLEDDPTLQFYDLVILHIDPDVAHKSYSDYGQEMAREARKACLGLLPCALPCPPPDATVDNLSAVVLSWLDMTQFGNKTVLCVPSKSSEAWLAASVFPNNQALLADIECALDLESRLAQLPKPQRIRKSKREYLPHSAAITARWNDVRQVCSRADVFHGQMDTITQRLYV
jgi:hypothetical protein